MPRYLVFLLMGWALGLPMLAQVVDRTNPIEPDAELPQAMSDVRMSPTPADDSIPIVGPSEVVNGDGIRQSTPECPHTEGWITFRGGGRMFYETYGNPAHTPIILVHGHTLDRRMWDEQVAVLKEHYYVVTPDSRGYGKSADPEEGYQFTHADDIIALMDSLHIERAHVVGLSMGGYVAGDLLALYPHRLLSSVMVSGEIASSWAGPSTPKTASEVAKEKRTRHAWNKNDDAYRRSRANSLVSIGGSKRERMRTALTAIVMDWGLWQVKHSTCRIYYARDAWRQFKRTPPATPFLIVYGDKERRQGYRSPMQNVAPQGQVVIINDCGHMVNMERPEEFNRVLMDFLRGL